MKNDVSHHGILLNLIFAQFCRIFSGKNRILDPENRIPDPEIYLCLSIFGLKHVISFFAVTLIWCKILREIQKNPDFRVFFDQFGWKFQVILTLTQICFNTNKFLDRVSGFPDPESGFFRRNLAKIVKKSGLTVYHDVIHQFSYSNHGKFKAARG